MISRIRAVAVLLLLSSGSGVGAEPPPPPADTTPVPLSRVEIVPPIETAGSGLAPAVSVRVTVGSDGRVSKVEIQSIRPPTALDEQFREATIDALSKWRFAPATRGGQAVEATLEWTVQFKPKEQEPRNEAWVPGSAFALTPDDQEWDDLARWSRHLATLDLAERREALGRIRTVARNLLRDPVQEATSDHFVVAVDGTSPDLAKAVAQNLEATYGCVNSLLSSRIEPQATPLKVYVFGYSNASSLENLQQNLHSVDRVAGFFDPVGIVSFHREAPTQEALLHVVIHEATHAFLANHVVRPGVQVPIWFNEGFAEYVANSEIRGGKIVPGSARPRQIYHYGDSFTLFGKSEASLSVAEVRKAIQDRTAIPLRELVTARPTEFYGQKKRCYYTEAWLLVHFLRHGRPSWADKEFPDFLLYLAEGYPPEDAFRGVYGTDPEGLTKEFETYVVRF